MSGKKFKSVGKLLKACKQHVASGEFSLAYQLTNVGLQQFGPNYYLLVFKGKASRELGKDDTVVAHCYEQATEIDADPLPAWLGLLEVHESQTLGVGLGDAAFDGCARVWLATLGEVIRRCGSDDARRQRCERQCGRLQSVLGDLEAAVGSWERGGALDDSGRDDVAPEDRVLALATRAALLRRDLDAAIDEAVDARLQANKATKKRGFVVVRADDAERKQRERAAIAKELWGAVAVAHPEWAAAEEATLAALASLGPAADPSAPALARVVDPFDHGLQWDAKREAVKSGLIRHRCAMIRHMDDREAQQALLEEILGGIREALGAPGAAPQPYLGALLVLLQSLDAMAPDSLAAWLRVLEESPVRAYQRVAGCLERPPAGTEDAIALLSVLLGPKDLSKHVSTEGLALVPGAADGEAADDPEALAMVRGDPRVWLETARYLRAVQGCVGGEGYRQVLAWSPADALARARGAAAQLEKAYGGETSVLDGAIAAQMAEVALTEARYADAVALYRDAAPEDPLAVVALGVALFELGDLDEAAVVLGSVLGDEDGAQAVMAAAVVAGEAAPGAPAYDAQVAGLAVAVVPAALSAYGWLCCESGAFEQGERLLKHSLEMDASGVHYLRLGIQYWKRGGEYRSDSGYAQKHLLLAARMSPDSADAFCFLGHYYGAQEGNDERSERCYRKALALDVGCDAAGEALCEMYVASDRRDIAVALCEHVLGVSPNGRVLWARNLLAFHHLEANAYDEAAEHLQASIRIVGDNVATWSGLGSVYLAQGKYVAALKAFDRAYTLCTGATDGADAAATATAEQRKYVVYSMAHINSILGHQEDAMEMFEQVLAEDAGYLPALYGLARALSTDALRCYEASMFVRARGMWERAVATLERATQCEAGNLVCVWKLAGDALVALGSRFRDAMGSDAADGVCARAVQAYEAALAINGDLAALWHDKAVAEFHGRRMSDAEASIARARELDRASPLFLSTEGVIRQGARGGNADEATAALYAAKGRDGTAPFVQQNVAVNAALQSEAAAGGGGGGGGGAPLEGALDEALTVAQIANPESALPWVLRGVLLGARGVGHEAWQAFQHAHLLGCSHAEERWAFVLGALRVRLPQREDGVSVGRAGAGGATGAPSAAAALEAVRLVAGERPHDATVLNMLGLLYELRCGELAAEDSKRSPMVVAARQSVMSCARDAFARALRAIPAPEAERSTEREWAAHVSLNYARALCGTGDAAGALGVLQAPAEHGAFPVPDSTAKWRVAGRALFLAGRAQEAVQAYTRAYELAGDAAEQHRVAVALAKVAFALGNAGVAKQYLQQVVAADPVCVPALTSLGALGLLTGETGAATQAIGRLLQSGRALAPSCYRMIAQLCVTMGHADQARSFLLRAVHVAPHEAVHWNHLARFLAKAEQRREAAACNGAALALVSGMEGALGRLTTHLENLLVYASSYDANPGKRLVTRADVTATAAEAVRVAQQMVHLHPGSTHAWTMLALAAGGTHADALLAYAVPVCQASLEAMAARGQTRTGAFRRLQKTFACACLARAQRACEAFAAAPSEVGVLQEAVTLATGAVQAMQAESLDGGRGAAPWIGAGIAMLAHCRTLLGEHAAALQLLHQAATASPADRHIWEQMAGVYAGQGACEAADAAYRRAHDCAVTGMGRTVPMVRAALMWMRRGAPGAAHAAEALKMASKACKKAPALLYLKALMLRQAGNAQQAETTMQKAIDADPLLPPVSAS